MRASLPFDTEKERRPLKFSSFSFSWRQALYLGGGLLLFLQVLQWTYIGSIGFIMNVIIWVMCLPILVPFVVCALMHHPQTGLYLDRHYWYKFRHKKTQSGVWRD
ncbi:PrgI family mobile element protein [Paenibacillus tepidiphilus]|uniref:PrgI family mobile element protein n=1 Tax=Paenibacillus tepidiphilus TaxID=2608683 RepID=UPI001239941F